MKDELKSLVPAVIFFATLTSGCIPDGGAGYHSCPDWVDATSENAFSLPEPRTVAVFGSIRLVIAKNGEQLPYTADAQGFLNWDLGVFSVSGADAQGYPVSDYSTGGNTSVAFRNGQGAVYLGITDGGGRGSCQGCVGYEPSHLMTCASLDLFPTLSLSNGATARLVEAHLRHGRPADVYPPLPELVNAGSYYVNPSEAFALQIDATYEVL